MKIMNIILIFVFLFSIILSLLSFYSKMTAIQLVKDMGLGYNFANTFECYNQFQKIKTPEEQITLWGNVVPTKSMIKNLKKYGFKTIRLPITWINFIDKMGNIDSNWIVHIKEVVDWIVKDYHMYCIINVHYDCKDDNWLSKGLKAKTMFIKLWSQISNEFINYDEHLLFESMDNPSYYISEKVYDFETLLILNQAFIDTVRNSGGNNKYRLLIISSGSSNLDLISANYKFPTDLYNKTALGINYFNPRMFCLENKYKWGIENDYRDMYTEFQTLKKFCVNKGIPVIMVATGASTGENKEIELIREYLYFLYSLTFSLNGMMACLWDTSTADFNYYDRVNDKWYDEQIKNNFKKISKGKYVNPIDFVYLSNIETVNRVNALGNMRVKIGSRRSMKVFFNVQITIRNTSEVGFLILGIAENEKQIKIEVRGDKGKKQYDGSYYYNIDISHYNFNDYIELQKYVGNDYIIFKSFSVEYEKSYTSFDYNLYKSRQNNI